jgi:hypothetical protein
MKQIHKKQPRASKNSVGAFLSNAGDQIVKRMTYPNVTLPTGAGTVIPVYAINSGEVQSNPASEWTSFAARYQQYRVRALRITGKATQPVQTSTISHGALFRGDFIGSSVPTTLAQVLSDENVRCCGTDQNFVDIVTWSRNPNAKLWNPTSAVIPTANVFSWICASASTPALTTATTYYALMIEWEVEFRGSQ